MRKGEDVHFFYPTERGDIDQHSSVRILVEKASYDPLTFYLLLPVFNYGIFLHKIQTILSFG